KNALQKIHGKNFSFKQEDIRFKDVSEFLNFLAECQKDNIFPYVVVPEDFKKAAEEKNLPFGVIHRPYRNKARTAMIYIIEWFKNMIKEVISEIFVALDTSKNYRNNVR